MCDSNHLKFNIQLVVGFRKSRTSAAPVVIKEEAVKLVDSYLGYKLTINWTGHIKLDRTFYKKGQQAIV